MNVSESGVLDSLHLRVQLCFLDRCSLNCSLQCFVDAEEYYAKMQGEEESFETVDTNKHGSKRSLDDSEGGVKYSNRIGHCFLV